MLVDAREKLHIPWGDQDNQKHGDTLMAFDTRSAEVASGNLDTSVFLQYLPAISALWADSGIQHAYDRRREFQLVGRWNQAEIKTSAKIMAAQFVLIRAFLHVHLALLSPSDLRAGFRWVE